MLNFFKCRKVKSPTRAHPNDAGIDFMCPEDLSYETMVSKNLHWTWSACNQGFKREVDNIVTAFHVPPHERSRVRRRAGCPGGGAGVDRVRGPTAHRGRGGGHRDALPRVEGRNRHRLEGARLGPHRGCAAADELRPVGPPDRRGGAGGADAGTLRARGRAGGRHGPTR